MTALASRTSDLQTKLKERLPELLTLERLMKPLKEHARTRVEATVQHDGIEFPIYSLTFGSEDPKAPTLGVFGGVHGLERIGSEVVIAWLQTLAEILNWDQTFKERLSRTRLVFMPIVNPVGMFLTKRSNGNGVDLMRNAPVTAEEPPIFLLGGQTYSKHLPWFRGNVTSTREMEIESKAICDLVEREILCSSLALTVDVHSGFGSVDRFWFPYAKTSRPPPKLAEITALKRLFDRSYPNHFYRIEPQSRQYTTHGDLWDWLFDQKLARGDGLYLPWTLELGSWLWLKKNPRQAFSSLGPFNPILPHRLQRILRRHLTLFDFLHRALLSPEPWSSLENETRVELEHRGRKLWYQKRRNDG